MAGNLLEKLQRLWNPPDDEYDEYLEEEEEQAVEPQPAYAEREEAPRRSMFGSSNNRVVSINPKAHLRMAAYRPVSFGEDIREIADSINQKVAVVLNLEKAERDEMRRILDFLSGVAYANDGKIKRVSSGTYIITPYNVDLSGEEVMDEFENAVYF